MKDTFRALAGRDFRLYFFGQCVSLIGTWVQQVAFGWIAYRITGSALMLGLIAFSGQIPSLVLSPFSSVVADRFSRRGVLVVIQVIQMALAALLAVLVMLGDISVWVLVAASLVAGVTGAIEMPVRQAFTPDIVHDRALLHNAIALNSVTFNAARLLGPAVAGLVLATVGEAACFAINALSYIATIYTLLTLHPTPPVSGAGKKSLAEGVRYLRQFAPARWVIITVIVASFCLAPYLTFMPVYAKDVLQGGPDTLGMLMASSGLGALSAALYLANRKSVEGLGIRMVAGCSATAFASIAFAYNHVMWLAFPLLVVAGGGTIMVITSCNILLQSMVPDDLRSNVMGLYTMSFLGVLPVASLAAGALAHASSVPVVFVLAGLLFAVMGLTLFRKLPALRAAAHPILREKGLLRP
ncbi:MAG: MFS transporter [Betaproteobacteria bacterium]